MKSILSLFFLVLVSVAGAADNTSSSYPMTTCVVSGDKLGQMEAPTVIHYQGKEVRLCCKECLKDFEKDPAKYMQRLHDAETKK